MDAVRSPPPARLVDFVVLERGVAIAGNEIQQYQAPRDVAFLCAVGAGKNTLV